MHLQAVTKKSPAAAEADRGVQGTAVKTPYVLQSKLRNDRLKTGATERLRSVRLANGGRYENVDSCSYNSLLQPELGR